MKRALFVIALIGLGSLRPADAAFFGSVFPVRGHLSDIAVDTRRNLIYAANFTAGEIEVFSIGDRAFRAPLGLPPASVPSTIAVSADGRYLVSGNYGQDGAVTIFDLDAGSQQTISVGASRVLAAAFSNNGLALIVTAAGVALLDPASAQVSPLALQGFTSTALPVPWATFPAAIVSGTASVSGDGNVVFVMIDNGTTAYFIRFDATTNNLVLVGNTSSPALGPRALSPDWTGATFLAGWVLINSFNSANALAQFPYPSGSLASGGHAFDWDRNLIYAQVTPGAIQTVNSPAGAPLLQSFEPDNLTVHETFQLRENLAGKALVFNGVMYGISDSGITSFPVGSLASVNRIAALQEDLLFQWNGGITSGQYLDIADPGGNATDFTLSTASPGVTFSATTGTTPARIQVFVDPTRFLAVKGTAVATIQISSRGAVNVPSPVRVLINTSNPNQQGVIYDVPGNIVDVLADPSRNRFYVLRQDRNLVLVFDGASMRQIGTLRTGNTPMQMAIYQDSLLVTADNSQFISVFDLNTLQPSSPITMPPGLYAHSIAAQQAPQTGKEGSILFAVRSVSATIKPSVLAIDFPNRTASVLTDPVYLTNVDPNTVLTPSPAPPAPQNPHTIFLAMPDGTVVIYDTDFKRFVASRKDVGGLGGAYGALSDNLFFAGNTLFGPSLVPAGQIDLGAGSSSGIALMGADGNARALLSGGTAAAGSAVLRRFALDSFSMDAPVITAEAVPIAQMPHSAPIGQIGQTFLPFTRTLAPLADGNTIIQLSTSGFMAFPKSLTGPGASGPPPVLSSVSNGADQQPGIAPGGLISLRGSGLSDSNATASLPASGCLNNACLFANNTPVPLLFISPSQITAQLPFNLGSSADLVLVNSNGASTPLHVSLQSAAPAVFRMPTGAPVIVRDDNGALISDSNPIQLDGRFSIFITGLGNVSPQVNAGVAAPSNPLATTTETPKVFIGPVQIFTLWSGLAPGMAGVYQINAQVPFRNISTGSKVQLTISQSGTQTILFVPVR
jgi:uncharacterized protein (TIGR03437 family)